jgi:GNAT superfamily N-acetyltransferase
MNIHYFNKQNPPTPETKRQIANFLFQQLEEYGDPIDQIQAAMSYALSEKNAPGGFILSCIENEAISCAVVVNSTGMGGYIPENILVYIATHKDHRGKGIGKRVMQEAITVAEGDIALHVEPENPAKRLYETLGFTSKYLEMRLKKGE